MATRPEHLAPPEIYYNDVEAKKYTSNTRIIDIQLQLSERAVELLALPPDVPCLILDLGCGSGLSGEVLTDNDHTWIGLDISSAMLEVAKDKESEGDLMLADLGQGMPFRPGSVDGAISISTLQWLCNADKKSHVPQKRLYKFFSTLYSTLSRGSRAVFQFYPENGDQVELVTQQAMKAGFGGGLVVDYPNSSKAKKIFLVLFTGGNQELPKGLEAEEAEEPAHAKFVKRQEKMRNIRGKAPKKSRDWILKKKEQRRQRGEETRRDSKYTGRKRHHRSK